MQTEQQDVTHGTEFIAFQKRVMRALRQIKGLSGPSVWTVLESCKGLGLSELHDEERDEIEFRLVQVNAIIQPYQLESAADYGRLTKSDAIRVLSHLVVAFDW